MTQERKSLPQRRASTTISFRHPLSPGGPHFKFHLTIGWYPDNRPGELFLNTPQLGNGLDTSVTDAAIAISLALQYGCPLEILRSAMKRNPDGTPMGILGHVIDIVTDQMGD